MLLLLGKSERKEASSKFKPISDRQQQQQKMFFKLTERKHESEHRDQNMTNV